MFVGVHIVWLSYCTCTFTPRHASLHACTPNPHYRTELVCKGWCAPTQHFISTWVQVTNTLGTQITVHCKTVTTMDKGAGQPNTDEKNLDSGAHHYPGKTQRKNLSFRIKTSGKIHIQQTQPMAKCSHTYKTHEHIVSRTQNYL